MTTFMDFRPFFNAMIVKMRLKDTEKGDSWKDKYWLVDVARSAGEVIERRRDVNDLLRTGLKKEHKEYFEKLNPDELPDIANYCTMLWTRAKKLFPDQNEDQIG